MKLKHLLLTAVLLLTTMAFGATPFTSQELGFSATFPGDKVEQVKGLDYTETIGVDLGKTSGYVSTVQIDLSKVTINEDFVKAQLNDFVAAQEITVDKELGTGLIYTTDKTTGYPVAAVVGTATTEEHKLKLNVYVAFIVEKDKNREYFVMGMIVEGQDGTDGRNFIGSFQLLP